MILFVDDELMFNENYVEALQEAGYQVHYVGDIEQALAFFRENMSRIRLVVLDIMFAMPNLVPAGIDEEQIMGGRRAGVEMLRLMNTTDTGRSIPKMILTNVMAPKIHDHFASSDEVKRCLRKRDTLPSQLVDIVNSLIGG